jgi:hypothetical protein
MGSSILMKGEIHMKLKTYKITAISMILVMAGVLIVSGNYNNKPLIAKAETIESENEESKETEPVYHYEILDKKEKTIAITKIDYVGESLSIPEKIDGYTVVRVGSNKGKYYTRKECRQAKYETLTGLVNYALEVLFYKEYKKEDFPEKERNLHVLSNEAGVKLKHLELPDTLKTIGGFAFQNCPLIEEIDLPSGLEYINAGAFEYNEKNKKIVIPKTVKKIGACAFSQSWNLRSVIIKSDKVIIGTRAFSQYGGLPKHENLTKIVLPEKVTAKQLKKWCFETYHGTSFVWPDCSGKNITTDWFGGQSVSIKHLKISKYAKKVVFGRCVIKGNFIKNLTIPARVKKVVVKQQPTTFRKFTFKGKDTKLVGEPKMGLYKNQKYISVAKVVAPKNAKAFQYAKKAKYPVKFYPHGGTVHWAMDPMNYYTEDGLPMKKVACVVKQ